MAQSAIKEANNFIVIRVDKSCNSRQEQKDSMSVEEREERIFLRLEWSAEGEGEEEGAEENQNVPSIVKTSFVC
jgi:hypothetical protein